MKHADRDQLKRQREEYKRHRSMQVNTQQTPAQSQQKPPVAQVQTSRGTQSSQVTTGSTMIGGLNEQTPNYNLQLTVSIGAMTKKRKINKVSAQQQEPPPNTRAFLECDTNANTCCLGGGNIISQYTSRTADVYAYDKSYKPKEDVPIDSGLTAYDDKRTGQT